MCVYMYVWMDMHSSHMDKTSLGKTHKKLVTLAATRRDWKIEAQVQQNRLLHLLFLYLLNI